MAKTANAIIILPGRLGCLVKDILLAAVKARQRNPILSGGGVSIAGGDKEVLELAEKAKIPVTTTLRAWAHFRVPTTLYGFGWDGARTTNTAVSSGLVYCNRAFSDRVTVRERLHSNARIMRDIDPAEIGKNINGLYP